ncbi:type IV secretory system conjugative DNA transfer family protein [Streptomyces sp. 4N509B]|uniref:type IV secretory system conjugative DNA transfer family protein n=1 Tax=Streptomyces sp. 4N509B TaxID=3457413 RepID=UPI003FD5FB7B
MGVTTGPGGPLADLLTSPGEFLPGVAGGLERFLAAHATLLVPALASAVVAAGLGRWRLLRWRDARFANGARCVTIMAPPQVPERGGEVLWAQLTGLLRPWWRRLAEGQPHVAFEYAWSADGMAIRLWVPVGVPLGLVRRAVEAAWPGAHTTVTDPPTPVPSEGQVVTAGRLRLARPDTAPLRTGHPADPLRPLVQAATGLGDGDTGLVQVLARPATGLRRQRARRAARRLKTGAASSGRLPAVVAVIAHRPQQGLEAKTDAAHSLAVRQAAEKLAGPLWAVSVAYAATTTATATADDEAEAEARQLARGRAHAIASAFGLFAGANWLARTRLPRPHRVLAERRFPRRAGLLSVAELAGLAHLPFDPDTPGLARAGARSVLPTPTVPIPGPRAKPLGFADLGPRRPVGLHVADARHHVHLMGATGSGKSTLIARMALDDIRARRGVAVVDPKGDLITELLDRLPEDCGDRLVVIDPDDPHRPPCLNVLEGDGDDVDIVVDNITGIFRRIFAAFWGPRSDDLMRAACLTLLRHHTTAHQLVTLADIPRLLTEPAFRLRMIPGLKDPVLKGFWAWYEALSDPAQAAVNGPVLNKLRAFLLRDFARRAIAQGHSTFHLADVLDGGILLARLPKGALGEETARLLGSFIVAKLWQSASARVRTPEAERIDAALYLDECHNFLTLPYPLEDMLAEARGYRLSLNLAHQHLAQLTADLREGISANARSKIFFTVSPDDARTLERHTAPLLTAHDLAHLGRYQAAARLLVGGTDTPAFTLTTRPLPPAIPGRARRLRAQAAARVSATPGPRTPLTPPTRR